MHIFKIWLDTIAIEVSVVSHMTDYISGQILSSIIFNNSILSSAFCSLSSSFGGVQRTIPSWIAQTTSIYLDTVYILVESYDFSEASMPVHSFDHSLIQQIYLEHLLSGRNKSYAEATVPLSTPFGTFLIHSFSIWNALSGPTSSSSIKIPRSAS